MKDVAEPRPFTRRWFLGEQGYQHARQQERQQSMEQISYALAVHDYLMKEKG